MNKKIPIYKKIITLIAIAIYAVTLSDYLLRKPSDLLEPMVFCGDFFISKTRSTKSAPKSKVKITNKNKVVEIFINIKNFKTKEEYELLSPYIKNRACIKYIKAPILKYLEYAVELSIDSGPKLSKKQLYNKYLNQGLAYTLGLFLLILFIYSYLYPSPRKEK